MIFMTFLTKLQRFVKIGQPSKHNLRPVQVFILKNEEFFPIVKIKVKDNNFTRNILIKKNLNY